MIPDRSHTPSTRPVRLGKDPIVDAVAEIRFKSAHSGVADLMQGLLYGSLRSEYPQTQSLAAAQLPRAVRDLDPALANVPLYEMGGDGGRILGADRSVGVAVGAPYPGWGIFKKRALKAFMAVLETGLVSEVERVSVKYINLLPAPPRANLQELIQAQIQVGLSAVSRNPLHLRTEFPIGPTTVILSLTTNATAQRNGQDVGHGLVVDIDVVFNGPLERDVATLGDALEQAHTVEKDFFYDLITAETLQSCEPIYDPN